MSELIYLASPYSDPDPEVKRQRFELVALHAAQLMKDGLFIFSPIAHTHPIALYGLPGEWAFWEGYDRRMLQCCDRFMVLKLNGWQSSRGVQAEMKIAKELGMTVEYRSP